MYKLQYLFFTGFPKQERPGDRNAAYPYAVVHFSFRHHPAGLRGSGSAGAGNDLRYFPPLLTGKGHLRNGLFGKLTLLIDHEHADIAPLSEGKLAQGTRSKFPGTTHGCEVDAVEWILGPVAVGDRNLTGFARQVLHANAPPEATRQTFKQIGPKFQRVAQIGDHAIDAVPGRRRNRSSGFGHARTNWSKLILTVEN